MEDKKTKIIEGIEEMKNGLEKIRTNSIAITDEQFIFDWIAVLDARLQVLKTSLECEVLQTVV